MHCWHLFQLSPRRTSQPSQYLATEMAFFAYIISLSHFLLHLFLISSTLLNTLYHLLIA